DTPRLAEIELHNEVLWFSALITLVVAVLISLAPAALTSARNIATQLRAGGRTSTAAAARLRGPLIAAEVALAMVLLCGALLMLRTIAGLYALDPGFRPEQVLTLRVQPSFASSQDEVRTYWRTVLPRLAALPGVAAVGTVLHLPMSGRKWSANIELEGEPLATGSTPPRAAWQAIGGDYFGALTIPLKRGRAFTDADREGAEPVVIVNEAFGQQILNGRDPIGRRIRAGNATSNQWVTIVGQVGSVRHDSLSGEPAPELYAPLAQKVIYATFIVMRTRADVDPRQLAPLVRNTIWNVHRDVPISLVRTMNDVVVASTMKRRLVMNLLVGYAIVGLLLGAVGIYGLVAYSVRQRTREIGIRLALGARPAEVTRLVATSGLQWALIGLAVGLPLALALTRFMHGIIFGIAERDTLSFTAAFCGLLLIAAAAAYLPARRAAATSPAIVLQE
ncbi:MAG TPA: FtsX-like permease family protein, partial [Longimicrobiales bacterium]|nr:FtsX-like permease family protein [Longimicrobiales bacterium]